MITITLTEELKDALVCFLDQIATDPPNNWIEWGEDWEMINEISKNKEKYIFIENEIALKVNKIELIAIDSYLNVVLQILYDEEKDAFKKHEVLFDLHEILINSYPDKKIKFHGCIPTDQYLMRLKEILEEKEDLPF